MTTINKKGSPDIITGTLKIGGKKGFVNTDNDQITYIIDTTDLNTALNNDTVEVVEYPLSLIKSRDKEIPGRVIKVLKRAKTRFVGIVRIKDGQKYIEPDDRKMYTPIQLAAADECSEGEKIVVEINNWTDSSKEPVGQIIKHLGQHGDNETEMQAIIIEQGFDAEFPPNILDEAEKLVQSFPEEIKQEANKRRDFRNITTLTIDPADAKDFDDALSFQKIDNDLFEVGVHIADVSHYIRPGTELDKEAAKRGTSIYLVDRTIPMLPEALSNNICSLRPDEDRLAFAAVFTMDKNGTIKKEWYGKTIIRSDRRFAYEEAQAVLDGKSKEYAEELTTLNNLAYRLREKKMANGAIAFESSEVKFELDSDGRPIKITLKERTDIHKMIEDFMLLANKKVAEYVSKKTKHQAHQFVYRIHDLPDMEKINELKTFLRPFGFDLQIANNHISQKEFNRILAKTENTTHETIVHRAAIRTMAKAIYSTTNIGHWGLAFEYYTHFTSPIRRYPDLLVHRLLEIYLKDERPKQAMINQIAAEIIHSTDMEIKATEAERESIKLKQVEFMQDQIGEVFDGAISGITKWGLFVEEVKTKADGMVHISRLGSDFFELDEKNYRLVGQKTGQAFSLGDTIKVKLIGADPIRRTLDFEIAK